MGKDYQLALPIDLSSVQVDNHGINVLYPKDHCGTLDISCLSWLRVYTQDYIAVHANNEKTPSSKDLSWSLINSAIFPFSFILLT